jgi:hypothetical protein
MAKVYHKARIMPRCTGREAPNERIVYISGFMVEAGCLLSIIEGERGLNIRIYNIDPNVHIAVEDRMGERRSA